MSLMHGVPFITIIPACLLAFQTPVLPTDTRLDQEQTQEPLASR